MSQHYVVLLLGSNLGNKKNNIQEALMHIESSVGSIIKKSEQIDTLPVEFNSENNFVNIAVSVETDLSPIKLLNKIKEIENKMGRLADTTQTSQYCDRIIDIDIVLFDHLRFESKKLQIPHPRNFSERIFARELVGQVL